MRRTGDRLLHHSHFLCLHDRPKPLRGADEQLASIADAGGFTGKGAIRTVEADLLSSERTAFAQTP